MVEVAKVNKLVLGETEEDQNNVPTRSLFSTCGDASVIVDICQTDAKS